MQGLLPQHGALFEAGETIDHLPQLNKLICYSAVFQRGKAGRLKRGMCMSADRVSIGASEFLEAIRTTTEREINGARWCGNFDAKRLETIISTRSRHLGGLVRRSVRLARLMSGASERGLVWFLYHDIPMLRATHFKRAIELAWSRGRLMGIATPKMQTDRDGSEYCVGVAFSEVEMASSSKSFDLDFDQMPLAAAFLDVLHNIFGFDSSKELLGAILSPRCIKTAEQVSVGVNDALQAWLRSKLPNEYDFRQAAAIAKFLNSTERNSIAAIDDEAVVDFWDFAVRESLEGFLLYRSAARKLVRYREGLKLAGYEASLASPDSISESGAEAGVVNLETYSTASSRSIERSSPQLESLSFEDGVWVSPLAQLLEFPSSRIKWLSNKDQYADPLGLILPSEKPETDRDSETSNDSSTGGDTALFHNGPPDLAFAHTLLRFAHFGRIQNRIVDGLKKSNEVKLASLKDWTNGGYLAFADGIAAVIEDLETSLAAATSALMARREPISIVLAQAIDPDCVASFRKSISFESKENIVKLRSSPRAVVEAFANYVERSNSLLKLKLKAVSRIARAGFRDRDRDDLEIAEGLTNGAQALIDVLGHVRRIERYLHKDKLTKLYQIDHDRFLSRLEKMYKLSDQI